MALNTAKAEAVMRLLVAEMTARPDLRLNWIDVGQRISRALTKDENANPEWIADQIAKRVESSD